MVASKSFFYVHKAFYKLLSDVLALPIFKQEESSLPPDNENKILPFQYVLCAATSPAVKLHDETLTYLNQGQSYEIRMLDNRKLGELPEINGKLVKVKENHSSAQYPFTDSFWVMFFCFHKGLGAVS